MSLAARIVSHLAAQGVASHIDERGDVLVDDGRFGKVHLSADGTALVGISRTVTARVARMVGRVSLASEFEKARK